MKPAITCFLFFALCGAASAESPVLSPPQYAAKQSDILKGVPHFKVVLEAVSADAEADGLVTGDVKALALARFSNAKIPVLKDSEQFTSAASPVLDIVINTLKTKQGVYSYSVTVSLLETVQLYRTPMILTAGTTWIRTALGVIPVTSVGGLTETVGSLLDRFIEDYQTANPVSSASVSLTPLRARAQN